MIYQGVVFKGTNMENSLLFLLIRCDDVVPRVASNLKGILQGGHLKERWGRVCRHGQKELISFLCPGSFGTFINWAQPFFACIIYEFPLMKNHCVQENKKQSRNRLIAKKRESW